MATDGGVFTSLQCHRAANWAQGKQSLMEHKPKQCWLNQTPHLVITAKKLLCIAATLFTQIAISL